MTPQPISAADYQFLCTFLREQIGYELGGGKEYLVESRLHPIAASFRLDNIGALVERLRLPGEQALRDAVIEAMADPASKHSIFTKLRQVIAPDGYLVLGESETVLGLTDQFRMSEEGAGFFRPAGNRR